MKKCKECGLEKPLDCFYVHSQMKDGHLNKCIECVKSRVLCHRTQNIKKIRAYDRKRGLTEKRQRLNRIRCRERYEQYKWSRIEWAKNNKDKIQISSQRSKEKYPLKYTARNKVSAAIKAKRLIPQPCEVCGNVKVHAHHDDYTKPLEVKWLCAKHHKELHRKYKE